MKLNHYTRHLTKDEERQLANASRKALFIYLLCKDRDREENKILLSCILSYIFVFVMILILILQVVQLSKATLIDEKMINSFVIKCILLFVFTVLFDLLVVGKKWYEYCNTVSEHVRKEIDNRIR